MSYKYKAAEEYWRNFYELSSEQKAAVREAWKVFKEDPFHPSLKSHKIHKLSAVAGETVYSAVIQSDLRVLFVLRGNLVYTLDVGTHDIYK